MADETVIAVSTEQPYFALLDVHLVLDDHSTLEHPKSAMNVRRTGVIIAGACRTDNADTEESKQADASWSHTLSPIAA